ncbi:MAG: adenylosuccinate synthetase [Alphaproteobacteria bacterium]|nr:adenylosuccinate synthetase [Alphaproteobacteria bacterium]
MPKTSDQTCSGPTCAKAVIGANYGDEGKGRVTDALCATSSDPIVIRNNGGAQAGHSVTAPDGRRHVFSHFGSGAFVGAPTFLSKFFVVLPRVFVRERFELHQLGETPSVNCDPGALITTPYDVAINRAIEEARGARRHGSVGVGFGETIERAENGFALTAADLADISKTRDILNAIASDWVPRRIRKLGLRPDDETLARLTSGSEIKAWRAEVATLLASVTIAPITDAIAGRTPVFEGAQGLLLDMDRGHAFPHVTRSNTGLRNILHLAREAAIDRLEVTYVTRAYLTRHGEGPLHHECAALDFARVIDPTNQPNPWQGVLRFAPLDADFLKETIQADVGDGANSGLEVSARLAITCLDQLGAVAVIKFRDDSTRTVPRAVFCRSLGDLTGLPVGFESSAPGRRSTTSAAA